MQLHDTGLLSYRIANVLISPPKWSDFTTMARIGLPQSRVSRTPNRYEKYRYESNALSSNWGHSHARHPPNLNSFK